VHTSGSFSIGLSPPEWHDDSARFSLPERWSGVINWDWIRTIDFSLIKTRCSKGGFGNLIALPLQKVPRESGFTEFLDDKLLPHADQWSYLASTKRVSQFAVGRLISEALQQGDLVGVRIACADDEDQPESVDPAAFPKATRQADSRAAPLKCRNRPI